MKKNQKLVEEKINLKNVERVNLKSVRKKLEGREDNSIFII